MNENLRRLLTGQSEEPLVLWSEPAYYIHRDMREALTRLVQEAERDGIFLRVCSAFRGFDRQVQIWNAKASGRRPLLDSEGRALVFENLQPAQVIEAILRWSALPGLSRHHWGTDIDVYDAAAVPEDYEVQLTPLESQTHFARLHAWLDRNMNRHGFFRPYAVDLGGIAPEAWHLSYAPLSQEYFEKHSIELLEETLGAADLVLKDQILARLPEIFERYFVRISSPI